jgi:hypothetical protein
VRQPAATPFHGFLFSFLCPDSQDHEVATKWSVRTRKKKEKDNGHTKEKRNNAHFVGLVLHKFLPLRGSFSFPWTIILMPL